MYSGYYNEELETFVEIPSDNCQFNEKPHMKAKEITAAGKEALTSGKFQMVRVNYANPGESFWLDEFSDHSLLCFYMLFALEMLGRSAPLRACNGHSVR